MDYMDNFEIEKFSSWDDFNTAHKNQRIVLMTTKTSTSYLDFAFRNDDILLAGSESAGVPDYVHNAADARITIPMQNGQRSLNIVNATSMILGEALRQTRKTAL